MSAQSNVEIAIVIAIIGAAFGTVLSFTSPEIGVIIIYLILLISAAIVLHGFAEAADIIAENSKRTTELMEFLTDRVEDSSEG